MAHSKRLTGFPGGLQVFPGVHTTFKLLPTSELLHLRAVGGLREPVDAMLSQDRSLLIAAATETKLENLARESFEHKLQACNEALGRFEAKYGLTFADFTRAWQKGKIPRKHSREVERDYDYMEWEARPVEKEELLDIHQSSRCSKR